MAKQKIRMKKEKISVAIDIWDFEGSIDGIINKLNKIKEDNLNYKEISFEIDTGYDSIIFSTFGYREETIEEKKKRLETAKKRKEAQKKKREAENKKKEETELKELKRLIDKYKDKL